MPVKYQGSYINEPYLALPKSRNSEKLSDFNRYNPISVQSYSIGNNSNNLPQVDITGKTQVIITKKTKK